jgi:hypothetical protein
MYICVSLQRALSNITTDICSFRVFICKYTVTCA